MFYLFFPEIRKPKIVSDFLRKFLSGLHGLEDNVYIGEVCRKTYDESLGKFHPWSIRKAAQLAMKFLPSKITLLNKVKFLFSLIETKLILFSDHEGESRCGLKNETNHA